MGFLNYVALLYKTQQLFVGVEFAHAQVPIGVLQIVAIGLSQEVMEVLFVHE